MRRTLLSGAFLLAIGGSLVVVAQAKPPAEKAAETETAVERPAEQAAEKAAEKSAEKSAEESAEESAEKSAEARPDRPRRREGEDRRRDGDERRREGEDRRRDGDRGPRGEGRGDRPGPPPNPWMEMFDTDRDGRISAEEITAASEVLKKLDKNEDGAVTREELPRPPRPPQGPRDGEGRERGFRFGPRGERAGGPDGRPGEAVAKELGVSPEKLREAFRKIGPPARGERPTPEQRESNRKALAEELGVSVEKLNEAMQQFRPRRPAADND